MLLLLFRPFGTAGPPQPPVIVSFNPSSGPVGTTVVLTGSGLTGATDVSFNGVPAVSFTVDSDTQITVTVPVGATDGLISVTTAIGTGSSATPFDVTDPVVTPSTVLGGGVKKRVRVRRSDFSSQENYEYALRAALLDAQVAIRPDDEPVPQPVEKILKPKIIVTDRALKVSAKDMAQLQYASEMEEQALIQLFIKVIEDEWE